MGPFKFLSTIFGAVAKTSVASLEAIESIANTVNVAADAAHQATSLSTETMLIELRIENDKKLAEIKGGE